MGTMNITQSLIDAGTKYRKELLAAPLVELAELLPWFNLKTSVQGKIVGGWLNTAAELRPYRTAKDASGGLTVTPEEMENYLGDVVKEFDPHEVLGSLYTELTSLGVTNMAIAKRIALEVARKVGEKLYDNLFVAVRNASGDNTVDLFDGFETLLAKAIVAGSISEAKGNYMDLTGTPISEANAGDVLKKAWREIDRILKKQRVRLLVPETVVDAYEDWYQNEYSTQPWNTGIEQKFLVGSRGRCELVPLNPMSGNFMIFSIKENMNILVDQMSDAETVRIRECDNPKLVQFFMKAYFGTGFETVQKEFMCAAKIELAENEIVP
jgi:hypothetical protein